jgi:exosome complex exonuclease DIS3/RRP44
MLSAEYFCSGSVSKETFGHYGLASEIYTHFTSPIRRYAGKHGVTFTSSQLLESLLDVLVHRQLAAAISYNPLHASLHSKTHVERTLDVVNKRHRMAQMAGRASVEFYVGLALKARAEKAERSGPSRVTEEAFVIRTFRNGLNVFVSKSVALFVLQSRAEYLTLHSFHRLGIEGLVTFKRETKFDADNYTFTIGSGGKGGKDVEIAVFDKVTVSIEVEKDKNTQRGKAKMFLVKPIDSRNM